VKKLSNAYELIADFCGLPIHFPNIIVRSLTGEELDVVLRGNASLTPMNITIPELRGEASYMPLSPPSDDDSPRVTQRYTPSSTPKYDSLWGSRWLFKSLRPDDICVYSTSKYKDPKWNHVSFMKRHFEKQLTLIKSAMRAITNLEGVTFTPSTPVLTLVDSDGVFVDHDAIRSLRLDYSDSDTSFVDKHYSDTDSIDTDSTDDEN
jgi:hypothetical protein